jgi:hypothetical protein
MRNSENPGFRIFGYILTGVATAAGRSPGSVSNGDIIHPGSKSGFFKLLTLDTYLDGFTSHTYQGCDKTKRNK